MTEIDRNGDTGRAELVERYDREIEQYRFHLDLLLKVDAFYLTATGAVFSYWLAHLDTPVVRWAVLFPIIASVVLIGIAGFSIPLMKNSQTQLKQLATGLHWDYVMRVDVLLYLLVGSIVVYASIMVLCLYLFFTHGIR